MQSRGAALARLRPDGLAPLAAHYDAVRGAARRRLALGLVATLALLLLSGWVAEVSPLLIWDKGHNFFGYFDRLLTLEQGDKVGQRVWLDPTEWFWGLRHWLGLLGN